MAVRVAASLGLAGHVAGGAGTIAELAARIPAHQPSLAALVRHLLSAGVLAEDTGGRLVLTGLGKQLRTAQDLLAVGEDSLGRAELSILRLLDSVRSGEPAYPLVFGRTFWADLAGNPRLKASFDAMNDAHLPGELKPLLAAYRWSSARHIVDLGGGSGALMTQVLTSFPRLRGTILELAANADVARRNLAAANLSDRCDVVAGSFFGPLTSLPHGTLVLSSVLHDWNDDDATAILRRCREALHPSESLIVVDSFADSGHGDTHMDLLMLAMFGGRQRTVADMAGLAEASGLSVAASRRLRRRWLLELKPSGERLEPAPDGVGQRGHGARRHDPRPAREQHPNVAWQRPDDVLGGQRQVRTVPV